MMIPRKDTISSLGEKYTLDALEENEYTVLEENAGPEEVWALATEEQAAQVLKALKDDSATGPDRVPTRLLKVCAEELARPFSLLAKRVWETGHWPSVWILFFYGNPLSRFFLSTRVIPPHPKGAMSVLSCFVTRSPKPPAAAEPREGIVYPQEG